MNSEITTIGTKSIIRTWKGMSSAPSFGGGRIGGALVWMCTERDAQDMNSFENVNYDSAL